VNRCGAERPTADPDKFGSCIGGCVRGADHRGVHRDAHWNEWGEPEVVADPGYDHVYLSEKRNDEQP